MQRLEGKVALVVGAGQTPGETIGNGRATAVLFAREGARVACLDRDPSAAEATAAAIAEEGGQALPLCADVTDEAALAEAIGTCASRWGALDVLHNNVGVSIAGGDAPVTEIEAEAFDRVMAINLRGMVLAAKHALPIMREQRSGVILTISSMAVRSAYPLVGYKTSKAGVVALTEQLAITNARYGIRANCILPGLMNTPMAIEPRVRTTGKTRDEVVAERDARVPLGGKMGSGWDVAHAALFLASDEARFITGVSLPVDGGSGLRVG